MNFGSDLNNGLLQKVKENVKQILIIIVTAILLAFFINIISSIIAQTLADYAWLIISFSLISILILIFIVSRSLLHSFSRVSTFAHCDIMYNEKEILEFPSEYLPQGYTKQLHEMISKRNREMAKRITIAPGQPRKTLHTKSIFTDFIEFLLLLWLSQEASSLTIALDMKEKATPLNQLAERPKTGNMILDMLSSIKPEGISEFSMVNAKLHLPDGVDIKFEAHDRIKLPDAGILILEGRGCKIEIRYHNSGWLPHVSSMGSRRFPWPRLGPILFNPFFLEKYSIEKLLKTKIISYYLELNAQISLRVLLSSYVSKEKESLIKWIDMFTKKFKQFFDINEYATNIENKHQWMAYEILDEIRTKLKLLDEEWLKKFDEMMQKLNKINRGSN